MGFCFNLQPPTPPKKTKKYIANPKVHKNPPCFKWAHFGPNKKIKKILGIPSLVGATQCYSTPTLLRSFCSSFRRESCHPNSSWMLITISRAQFFTAKKWDEQRIGFWKSGWLWFPKKIKDTGCHREAPLLSCCCAWKKRPPKHPAVANMCCKIETHIVLRLRFRVHSK